MQEWPLVGRQVELDLVADFLADNAVGGVVLAGPAGVGKTRLATECAAVAERAGFAALRVTGTRSAAAIPFGAIAPLLPSIEEFGDDPAVVLRRLAEELVVRGGSRPMFLVVDDAQLLDDASMTFIHQVAASRTAFVMATVRSDTPVPEPVVSLWKDQLAERIELGPLGAPDVRSLLVSALGAAVEPEALARLGDASGGNALFLRELVLGAIESGTLVEDGGRWRLQGSLSPSRRLAELIDSRLGTLSTSARRALELVAVAEPIELSMLETLTAPQDIEDLDHRQLVGLELNEGRLEARVVHPLYGEVLRKQMPVTAARTHQRALADAFEARGVTADNRLRVALWRLEGGGPFAPAAMADAARQASARFDFGLAERLARSAHQAGAGFDNVLLLASVLGATGRGEEADTLLAEAGHAAATDQERTMLTLVRMDNLCYALDRFEDARRVAEDTARLVDDAGLRAELDAKRAYVMQNTGRVPEALAIVEPLLQGGGRAFVWAALTAGYAYGASGRLADALAVLRSGAAARAALPPDQAAHLWHPVSHTLGQVLALSLAGELDEADAVARHEYEHAMTEGSNEIRAWFAWSLTRTSVARGDVDAAVQWADEAVTLFRAQRNTESHRWSLAELALAHATAGRVADADDALAEVETLPGEAVGWLRSELSRARAWRAIAANDLAAALDHLRDGVACARTSGATVPELVLLLDHVRLGAGEEALGRLAELAPTIEGPLAPAALAYAEATVAADGRSLERVGEAFVSFGALLLAAEAFTAAAVAFRQAGEARKGEKAEARAATVAARCPGARTPGLANPRARHVLSPREFEIAQLAATGLGRREIADRVGTSTRTVENQLQRTYAKLGISGRSELVDALESLTGT